MNRSKSEVLLKRALVQSPTKQKRVAHQTAHSNKPKSIPIVVQQIDKQYEIESDIRRNESAQDKLNKLNSMQPRSQQRPSSYGCALLRFEEKNGIVHYFNKKRHPKRSELAGVFGKLSMSDTLYLWQMNTVKSIPVRKFIKSVRTNKSLTPERLEQTGKITQLMYPTTHYRMTKPDKLLVIMDYLPGMNLFDFIEKGYMEQLDNVTRMQLALSAVNEVVRLHAFGYIHGDIKPENFMIDIQNKRIYLIDFDFARSHNHPAPACGSPCFLPWQMLSDCKRTNSPESDIFGLGFVLFSIFGGYIALASILEKKTGEGHDFASAVHFQQQQLTEAFIHETIKFKNSDISKMMSEICHPDEAQRLVNLHAITHKLSNQIALHIQKQQTIPIQPVTISEQENQPACNQISLSVRV